VKGYAVDGLVASGDAVLVVPVGGERLAGLVWPLGGPGRSDHAEGDRDRGRACGRRPRCTAGSAGAGIGLPSGGARVCQEHHKILSCLLATETLSGLPRYLAPAGSSPSASSKACRCQIRIIGARWSTDGVRLDWFGYAGRPSRMSTPTHPLRGKLSARHIRCRQGADDELNLAASRAVGRTRIDV
jgi:hypothetical protein